jgi:hypothetical protein
MLHHDGEDAMAEIRIQPKREGGRWWLWLLPLLLLGLLIWYLTRNRGDEQTAQRSDTTAATRTAAPAGTSGASGTTSATSAGAVGASDNTALSEYVSFIGATDASRDESAQHQYTAEGIRRLAAAIEGSSAGARAGDQIVIMRAMADSLQQTPRGNDRHADMARAAFDAAIVPLTALDAGSASRLQTAARALRPDRDLLAQKSDIQRFFEAAREALQATRGSTAGP